VSAAQNSYDRSTLASRYSGAMKYLTMLALAIAAMSIAACAHKEEQTYHSSTSSTATRGYSK